MMFFTLARHPACRHPTPSLPVKGRVLGQWLRHGSAMHAMRHLPLDGGGWEGVSTRAWPAVTRWLLALLLSLTISAPALAIDPPYQRQMERLSEIMGSLYFLQPLCKAGSEDWRAQMAELIALDEPSEDRRQRLAGAFNGGYTAFSRFHKQCTPASREALTRLLGEAQRLSREIHTRFAE
jgi:uncharacterized protein (TIGR02301 family)